MAKAPKKPDLAEQIEDATLEDSPLGMLPDGRLNVVNRDDPPWKPEIVDDEGNPVDEGLDDDED